jgi:hypothetical protein
LPVRVGAEADRGVEGRVGRYGPEALRVEREDALEALERVHEEDAPEVEQEHRNGVRLPALLGFGPDAREPVDSPLEPAEDRLKTRRPAVIDPGHVEPERLRQQEQDAQIEHDLEDTVRGHENTSGFRRATTR